MNVRPPLPGLSLKRQLLLWLLLPQLVLWMAGGVAAYKFAAGYANQAVDASLLQASRALARHKRLIELAALDIVPPPTYNTAGTTYVPQPCSYQRNAGNKHIAGAGVGC